ncbi:aspartyl-phosphate phosphatase Spo0E family protein [Peribacillus sp. NJ4]|uniref:aspartyl-phosphate phosphatase Spo0E family protein n=1 Tax=Peribacillus TaxID=2675229 RepID=UPI0025A04F11|nr:MULTISPECIES: aspartyl-phosphate phosphatase Spo0E family protein [unclassified Peribacillus]MDM5213185.1 aspartyl-phosphate phosphatase Spo0E family protein [Peribacillus sp. NJ4]MDM5223599.1 aspartyl-phosphate phosphatase Spo0E family protein [Peribacillus sp. NJ11]
MNTKLLSEIETKINYLKGRLIVIGMLKGLSHSDTIKTSQELDEWLYKYQIIKFN